MCHPSPVCSGRLAASRHRTVEGVSQVRSHNRRRRSRDARPRGGSVAAARGRDERRRARAAVMAQPRLSGCPRRRCRLVARSNRYSCTRGDGMGDGLYIQDGPPTKGRRTGTRDHERWRAGRPEGVRDACVILYYWVISPQRVGPNNLMMWRGPLSFWAAFHHISISRPRPASESKLPGPGSIGEATAK